MDVRPLLWLEKYRLGELPHAVVPQLRGHVVCICALYTDVLAWIMNALGIIREDMHGLPFCTFVVGQRNDGGLC